MALNSSLSSVPWTGARLRAFQRGRSRPRLPYRKRKMPDYNVGDKVRVIQVPPYLYTDNPVDQETAKFFERCLGKVFRVEGFDENRQLELWTTEKGNPRKTFRGLDTHTIWIEPKSVEPA